MGELGKKNEHPRQRWRQSKEPPPATIGDDDVEDGTPKHARYGDQPL